MGYFKNLLVSVDQMGNTIAGGDPDNTISARVGYFSQVPGSRARGYWKLMEKIINFTFWPVDGPDHCLLAFEDDPEETFYDGGSDFVRFLLSLIIIAFCIPIAILLYFFWLIVKIFGGSLR